MCVMISSKTESNGHIICSYTAETPAQAIIKTALNMSFFVSDLGEKTYQHKELYTINFSIISAICQ